MPTITTATAQGRRKYQEDRCFTVSHRDGTLLAVFDGHGGDNTCTYLDEHFVGKFLKMYEEQFSKTPTIFSEEWRAEMVAVYRSTFSELAEETNEMRDGSTASVVWIPRGGPLAAVAILGDSPVIIGQKGGFHLSPEHNARTNMAERQAAQERGAFYSGGYLMSGFDGYGLQMSRAFGDSNLSSFLNREPEIYFQPVEDFILVGTDGILDPSHQSHDMVADVVDAIRKDGATAQNIVDVAVALPTEDNATAILWRA